MDKHGAESIETDVEKSQEVVDVTHQGKYNEVTGQHGTIVTHSFHDADVAMKAMAAAEGVDLVIDEATNRRLVRRIDLVLMPMMCLVYMMNYLDKTTLSYASIMGLKTDLHLVGDNYQWLGSVFYFGYLGAEYPTNVLLQRLPLGKYSSVNIMLWGGVLACMAGTSNFGGAIAVRFFLGLFEAAVTPGFVLFTSQWYTKREQGARIGIWFCFNGMAQILGGLIAYGVAHETAIHGSSIEPWKILFIAFGLFTFLVGVVFWFIMPDNQLNAWFLNKQDRILAIERIRQNEQGVGNKHFKIYQLKEALLDPVVWMITLFAIISDIPNGGITNFFSQLIVSFGYTDQQSLLYGTPAGAVEVIALAGWGVLTYYYPNRRILFAIAAQVVALVGVILLVALPLDNSNGRLAGYYLYNACPTSFVCLLSLISTNVAGYTKKTTVAALYLIGYCVGNIIGPQTFRPSDAPRYVPAEITILVCFGVEIALLALIWAWSVARNRRKALARQREGYVKLKNHEFLDLTDGENPEFVYVT